MLSGKLLQLYRGLHIGALPILRRSFKVPLKIRLHGKNVLLSYPNDGGVKEDFLTCFIDDIYGLSSRHDPRPKTILDIGANVGFFSLAARSYFSDATIHAYEPNPRVLKYLTSNAAVGSFLSFPQAVGAEVGSVSIVDESDSNLARTIPAGQSSLNTVEQVALSLAVERLGGHVDLLKMDCEGAEWDIFQASSPWQYVKELRMEYHLIEDRQFSDVEKTLKQLSFEITSHIPQGSYGIVRAKNRLLN